MDPCRAPSACLSLSAGYWVAQCKDAPFKKKRKKKAVGLFCCFSAHRLHTASAGISWGRTSPCDELLSLLPLFEDGISDELTKTMLEQLVSDLKKNWNRNKLMVGEADSRNAAVSLYRAGQRMTMSILNDDSAPCMGNFSFFNLGEDLQ